MKRIYLSYWSIRFYRYFYKNYKSVKGGKTGNNYKTKSSIMLSQNDLHASMSGCVCAMRTFLNAQCDI